MQTIGKLSRSGLVGLGLFLLDPLQEPSPYVPQSGLGMLGTLKAHAGGLVSEISIPELTSCSG